jgi:hypothetical protein
MNNFCNEIEKSLESANKQTAVLLEQSDSLKSQRLVNKYLYFYYL